MKIEKFVPFLLVVSLLVAACSAFPSLSAGGIMPGPDSMPGEGEEPIQPELGLPTRDHGARARLANYLGIDMDSITVVSAEEGVFSNACLEAALSDEMCAEVITPGFLITLEADGQTYVIHSNGAGTVQRLTSGHGSDEPVVLGGGIISDPSLPTILWTVEGGMLGLCDSLRISGGSAEISSCKDRAISLASLTPEHAAQVETWQQQFASFEYSEEGNVAADGLLIQLIFNGQGDAQPTTEDIQAMQDFLWQLLGS